jgi:hypothetical protein
VSPVRYELGSYISEDDILNSHCRENAKSYPPLTGWPLQWRRNVSPVRYEVVFYIPQDGILHSHCTCTLRSVLRLLVAASVVPSSQIFVTLMKEVLGSSETSVLMSHTA